MTVCPNNLVAVWKNNTHKLKEKKFFKYPTAPRGAAVYSLGIAWLYCRYMKMIINSEALRPGQVAGI